MQPYFHFPAKLAESWMHEIRINVSPEFEKSYYEFNHRSVTLSCAWNCNISIWHYFFHIYFLENLSDHLYSKNAQFKFRFAVFLAIALALKFALSYRTVFGIWINTKVNELFSRFCLFTSCLLIALNDLEEPVWKTARSKFLYFFTVNFEIIMERCIIYFFNF